MNLKLKYEELQDCDELLQIYDGLRDNLAEIQKTLDQLLPYKAQYHKMSLPAQIELDLFFAYTLNSLHWIHLRIEGIDPTKHPIKHELDRLKVAMMKWQEYKLRENRPTVNIEAAKRFIRSGLYDRYRNISDPPNEKTRFNIEE